MIIDSIKKLINKVKVLFSEGEKIITHVEEVKNQITKKEKEDEEPKENKVKKTSKSTSKTPRKKKANQ